MTRCLVLDSEEQDSCQGSFRNWLAFHSRLACRLDLSITSCGVAGISDAIQKIEKPTREHTDRELKIDLSRQIGTEFPSFLTVNLQ